MELQLKLMEVSTMVALSFVVKSYSDFWHTEEDAKVINLK